MILQVLEEASLKKDEINKDNILPKPSEENLRLEPRGDEAKNGEKILYGLHGIKEGNDIAEGELDKLSPDLCAIPSSVY
ncbi:hypothetical protein Tco_1490168 [Tanacetum coccineum]